MNEYIKDAQELLNKIKDNGLYADEAAEYLQDFQNEYGTYFDIITADELDEMTKREAEDGYQRVMCFLANVNDLNANYYHINGYGNAEDLTLNTIECYLSDIINGYYA